VQGAGGENYSAGAEISGTAEVADKGNSSGNRKCNSEGSVCVIARATFLNRL
jgi:2-phospho-L-lactate transferase/gluconeogenesis factor (CofD/UPF0052 family)